MTRNRTLGVYALNIAADPHPPGIYISLLKAAARKVGPAHGSDAAKITAPKEVENRPGIYVGRILVWTEVDLKGRWLDVDSDEDLSDEDRRKINIPGNAKPNFRVFNYAFHEKKHRFYFEASNEYGHSLGPKTAERIMVGLFSSIKLKPQNPNVSVTVIPKDGQVRKILSMPGLRKLEISLTLPNPDQVDPAKRRRIYKQLKDNKAKRWEQIFTKEAGANSLTPTDQVIDFAEIAAENGNVRGEGWSDGKKSELSTSSAPRRETITLDDGPNFLERLVAAVGFF